MLALFKEWLRTPDRLRLNVCSNQTTCVRFETHDVHAPTAAAPSHALLRLQVRIKLLYSERPYQLSAVRDFDFARTANTATTQVVQKWAGYPPSTVKFHHFEFDATLAPAADFCCAAFFDRHIHEHLRAGFLCFFACAFIYTHQQR